MNFCDPRPSPLTEGEQGVRTWPWFVIREEPWVALLSLWEVGTIMLQLHLLIHPDNITSVLQEIDRPYKPFLMTLSKSSGMDCQEHGFTIGARVLIITCYNLYCCCGLCAQGASLWARVPFRRPFHVRDVETLIRIY